MVRVAAVGQVAIATFLALASIASAQVEPKVRVDHRAEVYRIIQSFQRADESEGNSWDLAAQTVNECAGMLRMFDANSAVMQKLPEAHRGASSWLVAFASRDKGCTPELDAEARRCLAQIRKSGITNFLDAVCDGKRFVPKLGPGPLLDQEYPIMGGLRAAGQLCWALQRDAADANNAADYARAFECRLALGRVSCSIPLIIGRLVGVSLSGGACRSVSSDIVLAIVPPGALDSVKKAMARQAFPDAAATIELERQCGLETIENYYDSINNEANKAGHPGAAPVLQGLVGVAIGSRETSLKLYNRIFDDARDLMKGDAPVRERARTDLAKVDAILEDPENPEYSKLVSILAPAFGKFRRDEQLYQCSVEGLRTMIAIEAFRTDRKRWPDALDELVPEYLDAVPRDPFKPEATLRYKRLDPDTDALKRPYLLYSVGADAEDNAGKQAEYSVWAAQDNHDGRGFDLVINAVK